MDAQLDLLSALTPACADCPNLGDAIDSGIRYCWGDMRWRWPSDRVEGCVYRGRACLRPVRTPIARAEILRDFLENPKHSPSPKDRKWLLAELRREERRA